ncbi:CNNM domain-containing protein [Roseiconus nitratireducens]|nr:CNNM domain-containing protein [Roseiconus nitratireducens]
MLLLLLLIIAFLALSGLMAAVDAAVLSVTRPEIDVLVRDGRWGARRLSRVKREIVKSVVVIVILTNTINVLGPILVSQEAYSLYGAKSVAAITVVLTFGTIVFSEIIPKALGAHYAPRIARLAAPGILAGRYLMYPLVIVFAWLSEQFTRGTRPIGTEGQIRSLVRIGHRAGYIESDEGNLIHRAFILNDKTAGEIMTPLRLVKALGADYTIKQAAAEIGRSEYSRYPVFGQSTDDIQGIALSRDVFKAMIDQSTDRLSAIAREAVIVDAQTKSDELLSEFRDKRFHLAVVRDLDRTVGVVTLEDVLEELVGEIEDEKDLGGRGRVDR